MKRITDVTANKVLTRCFVCRTQRDVLSCPVSYGCNANKEPCRFTLVQMPLACTCEVYFLSPEVLATACQFEGLALDQTLDQQLPKRLPERQEEQWLITNTHTQEEQKNCVLYL